MKKIEYLPNSQIDASLSNLLKNIDTKLKKLEKISSKKDMAKLENKINILHQEMEKLELRMVIKLGSLIAFSISILATFLTIS